MVVVEVVEMMVAAGTGDGRTKRPPGGRSAANFAMRFADFSRLLSGLGESEGSTEVGGGRPLGSTGFCRGEAQSERENGFTPSLRGVLHLGVE